MTRFRELRLQRGLSQEQLCRLYNEKYNRKYTTAAMSLIEHDKRSPELGALLDFADFYDFYGVSLDYLLGRDQEKLDYSQVDCKSRTWYLSEQLRNIVLGLYNGKVANKIGGKSEGVDSGVPNVGDGVLHQTEAVVHKGQQNINQELRLLGEQDENEENLEMLRSLLKQSIVLAKRVEKNKKSWYKY